MRLRSGLLFLVLATAVPVVAFALLASALVVKHQHDNYKAAVMDRNRAFMSAVDAELKGTIVTLQAMTASRSLQEDDLQRFYNNAIATLATQPNWLSIVLLAPEGEQVVNTMAPWGAPLSRTARQPASLEQVARTLRPSIGDVIFGDGRFSRAAGIPVRVPVLRDGRLVYVLTAVVNPESFAPLVAEQRLPEGWVTGLVDAEGKFVARVPAKPVGSAASPDYLAAIRASPEGWYRGKTVEGLDTYTAYVRSDLSGWSVGFAIPAQQVLGGAQRAAWLMGGGVLLSLALAVAIALWLGRRISGPIAQLSSAAHDLGTGSAPIDVRTPISEVHELARALNDASRAIQERDRDLRRSEERFRLSQETAAHGFTLFKAVRDPSGNVVDLEFEYINPTGAAMSGQKPEELIGRWVSEAFPGAEETGIVKRLREVVETGRPLDCEIHYQGDGVDGWYRHLAVKIGDGVGTSYIDITAKKQLEEELKNRAEALSRADRNKSEFLAMLSHELRNPLAPLVNGAALLKAWGVPGRVAQIVDMMERQIKQLARLIDDLLDISRIDRGKLELRRERVAAESIVRAAVEIARPNIEARNHELVLRYPGAALYLDADPVRMAQVLSNILNNAAKFTPSGGRIEVALGAEGEDVVFGIADNGIGLSPEDTTRIFDMFVQLDASRSQAAGGLGLGLTLARTILERHGGKIRADSAGPGQGTRFTVRLAAAPAPKAQPQLHRVLSREAGGRRVLVVDDNIDAANMLSTLLQHGGHEVRAVYSGDQALAAAEEFRPDCVVLDLNLPGMDGVEIGRRLRDTPWGREVSLIAMTGMGQPADLARTRAAGFDHHMTKPVEPQQVLDLVATAR